jgi:hypothetical protein
VRSRAKVFLDLDGVLADLLGGFGKALDHPCPYTTVRRLAGLSVDPAFKEWSRNDELWNHWPVTDVRFWCGLEPFPVRQPPPHHLHRGLPCWPEGLGHD